MTVHRRRRRPRKASGGRTAPVDKVGAWRLSSHGYVTRQRVENGKRLTEYQHRTNMEEFLGRKLVKGETVHHRNGDKTDNRVGPGGNLELWSTTQPAGQRVEDKLAYAWEMIRLYGDSPLRPS